MADNLRVDNQVDWQIQLPGTLPLIQADPDRLRQILLNLLSNARKFTQRGQVKLGAEVASPYLHVWVEDTGIGIPVEQQEDIFEPFVTTKSSGKGSGLGLYNARLFAEKHGAAISLDTNKNGTTFHIWFRQADLEESQPAE